VLAAINPWHAVHFLLSHGTIGLVTLARCSSRDRRRGAIRDLGHFGRKPIQAGWLISCCRAIDQLFGQGALVLSNPAAIESSVLPDGSGNSAVAAVVLATAATVIASQAVITGAIR